MRRRRVTSILLAQKQNLLGKERRRTSATTWFFVISMYDCFIFQKLHAESAEIFSAILWEQHCISAIHCRLIALQKFVDRTVCHVGGETGFHQRSAPSKWVFRKTRTLAVWWAQITKMEDTQHANFFIGIQLHSMKVHRPFWATKDFQSSESAEWKRQGFLVRYLWWACAKPLKMRKGDYRQRLWLHASHWLQPFWLFPE